MINCYHYSMNEAINTLPIDIENLQALVLNQRIQIAALKEQKKILALNISNYLNNLNWHYRIAIHPRQKN